MTKVIKSEERPNYSESCFQIFTPIESNISQSTAGRGTDSVPSNKQNVSCMGTLSSFPIIQETPKKDSSSKKSQLHNDKQTSVHANNNEAAKRHRPSELKFKIESMGTQPEEDDDIDMCPARTRSAWPVDIVTWWKPSQPREKPPYSYATLIAHAILSSKDGRLTLSDIYRWISVYYPFFTLGRRGWQNSIRHNLSLNKKWFVKLDRRPTQANPGKGCYWTLISGTEQIFIESLTQAGGHSRKHHDIGLTAELSANQRRGSCFYAPSTAAPVAPSATNSPLMVSNAYFASTHMFITRPEDYQKSSKGSTSKPSSMRHPQHESVRQNSVRHTVKETSSTTSLASEKAVTRASMYSTFRMSHTQVTVQEPKEDASSKKASSRKTRRRKQRASIGSTTAYEDSEYDSGVDVSNEYIGSIKRQKKNKTKPLEKEQSGEAQLGAPEEDELVQPQQIGSLCLEGWDELLNIDLDQLQAVTAGFPVSGLLDDPSNLHFDQTLLDHGSQAELLMSSDEWLESMCNPAAFPLNFNVFSQPCYPTLLTSSYEPTEPSAPAELEYTDVLEELFKFQQEQQQQLQSVQDNQQNVNKHQPLMIDLNDEITAKYLHFENDSVNGDEEKWTCPVPNPYDGTFVDPPSPTSLGSVLQMTDYSSMRDLLYS